MLRVFYLGVFLLGIISHNAFASPYQDMQAISRALDEYEAHLANQTQDFQYAQESALPLDSGTGDNALINTADSSTEEQKTLLGDMFKEMGIDAPTGSVTMDVYDRYVWRGQYLDRDAVVQPGFSLSAAGFTVGYWGSTDMENTDALTSDESDYYVSYAYTMDDITLGVGHTWYDFPEYNTSSKEYYVSLGVAAFLNPTFMYVHDYEDGKDLNTDGSGNYYSLAISHSIDLGTPYGMSLDLASTFGYVDGQWLSGRGWHITPTVGLKIPISKNAFIIPTIGYNAPMGDLEDEAIGNQEEKVFGGVKSLVTF